MNHTIETSLMTIEGVRLGQLLDEYRELLRSEATGDPALERLSPTPYPEDAGAARDFAAATRQDLLDRRVTDADLVITALTDFGDPAALTEEEALRSRNVRIPLRDVDSWLRALNGLRLVIATRLGIVDDDQDHSDDARFGVYDWLGYRLELLIEAADEAF